MKSNYKRLGDYIKAVNRKNTDLRVSTLLGVSIQKIIIPSIANTVGTNMKTYKIIKKNQFAYGPVTSRNGEKISIALLQDHNEGIISQAYTVFEVKNHEVLAPEYLMMWFRRPEFDRYARYHSHGSVREIFDWEAMCGVRLPVPSINNQREIVKEYKAVENRIRLNERLIHKLEETAQAIYRSWFVEFEFPISKEQAAEMGNPELEGKPYKSSGGKMVWNDELAKYLPKGWNASVFSDIINITSGKAPISKCNVKTIGFEHPVYGAGGIIGYTNDFLFNEKLLSMGRVGTHGIIHRVYNSCWPSDNTLIVTSAFYEYTYNILNDLNYDKINRGGVQGLITQTDIKNIRIVLPNKEILVFFERVASVFMNLSSKALIEKEKLFDLKALLLSRLAQFELEKETETV